MEEDKRQKTEGRRQGKRVRFSFSHESLISFLFCFLVSVLCFLPPVHAFDVKGLQPLSPYGVFSTFSAESLMQNKYGFGLSLDRSKEPDFYRTTFHFAYGVHDRLEFNITLPYIMDWDDRIDGFEDLSIGIKHRIIDEGKYNPAVAYMLTLSVPSGKNNFSTEGGAGGGILITKKVGPFKGHLNAFYSKPGESKLKDEYMINLGAEMAVAHNSKMLAEVVGRKNYFRNKIDLLEWRFGYRIATTDYIYTTIGAGFDIKKRSPDYRLMFSVSFILPKEKRTIQRILEE